MEWNTMRPAKWLLPYLVAVSYILHMLVVGQTVDQLGELQPVWQVNNPQAYQQQAYQPTPQVSSVPLAPQGYQQPVNPQFPTTPTTTPSQQTLVPFAPTGVNGVDALPPTTSAAPAFPPAQQGFTLSPAIPPAQQVAPPLPSDETCDEPELRFYNLTRDILGRFCTVISLADLRQLGEQDIETCCQVGRTIVEDQCFDPCTEEQNAFDPSVVLVDLWRAVCRVAKRTCFDAGDEVQKAASVDADSTIPSTTSTTTGTTFTPQPGPALPPATQPPVASSTPTNQISLSQIFEAVPGLSLLAGYLRNADMLRLLENPADPITVFAPTNAAFIRFSNTTGIPLQTIEAIPGWMEILLYHVVRGAQDVGSLSPTQLTPLTTTQGNTIMLLGSQSISSCCVSNNTAQVLVPDTIVSNGIFHIIDNVLQPFVV